MAMIRAQDSRYSPSSDLKESYSRTDEGTWIVIVNCLSLAAINTQVVLQGDSQKPRSNKCWTFLEISAFSCTRRSWRSLARTWNDSADKNAGEVAPSCWGDHKQATVNCDHWAFCLVGFSAWEVTIEEVYGSTVYTCDATGYTKTMNGYWERNNLWMIAHFVNFNDTFWKFHKQSWCCHPLTKSGISSLFLQR